ncbi:linoleate 13S-lipoxygenase 3-1, chloroplastic [Cryptomeria japonica]|uniref:linoleate 13S-lipoxygenase 3-1, chloroplastic n=1 Tax=Cryptomeria japonica TaxID=3369 RepID=UPI0025ACB086|nr:linoleate 13S-lipoxygenase 3-1, chloroplastic [Cryptomeria japonica]
MLQLVQPVMKMSWDQSPLVAENFGPQKKIILSGHPKQFSSQRKMYKSIFSVSQQQQGEHFGRRKLGHPILRAVVSDKRVPASAPATLPLEKPVELKLEAIVTVRRKRKEDLSESIQRHIDSCAEVIGQNVVLQLVSEKIDPKTNTGKRSNESALKGWLHKSAVRAATVDYTANFTISSDFGLPGAIIVTNRHNKEFFLEKIVIKGLINGPVFFSCKSWVQSKKDGVENRVFFSDKPYLPSQTPPGLKDLRLKELQDLRGNGQGERKHSDRIYDYDLYNDLGNPDQSKDLARPVLGTEQMPYPRRCRTGRPPTKTDPSAETRMEKPGPLYVPRDETFEELKQDTINDGRTKALGRSLIPALLVNFVDPNKEFECFAEVEALYKEGFKFDIPSELLKKMPKVVSRIREMSDELLRYDTPSIISKDRSAWLRDDEFARQTLAGVNPVSIERLKEFPPVSKLDPETYGSPESALKEEHITGQLNGMSVKQAIEKNKLFILDYHDAFIPVANGINALDGRKTYATRTIFFLTPVNTLKPVAIELSLPSPAPGSRAKRVFTPANDSISHWLWQLAKAHVCSNDAGVHQLVNHWLRTHACTEPYVIAAHRHLSAMHPIFKLLHPHMRYTMEINAMARQTLISAEGVIESSFTPGKYCMDISVAAYRKQWRFDMEGLPADLIRRGMAVEDSTQPHGVRLVIEDYPYAADGLLIWSAIKDWVEEYVACYYSEPGRIQSDVELQAWWEESKNEGHPELRNEPWWPKLETKEDLVGILTTMIWIASGQHAALNFGQYPYGGFVPNRPCLMRRLVPEEKDPEYQNFISNPQKYFLSCVPSLPQALGLMAVIDTLSTHSPDEEYLGQKQLATSDINVVDAFHKFSARIQSIENIIEQRNKDLNLRNRNGAGMVPYELLMPSSGPGVTGRGIPNSVSI